MLLFADEPDGQPRHAPGAQIIDLLFDLNAAAAVTLVLVTHDERIARALCAHPAPRGRKLPGGQWPLARTLQWRRTTRRAARTLRFALLGLAREWRAGELGVLIAAIVIAVAAMTAVTFFTERVSRAVDMRAAWSCSRPISYCRSGRPIAHSVDARCARGGARDDTQGSLRQRRARRRRQRAAPTSKRSARVIRCGARPASRTRCSEAPATTLDIPAPGEAWLDAGLYARLGVDVGATIHVGELALHATRACSCRCPIAAGASSDLAPPLLMNIADVPRRRSSCSRAAA